METVKVIKNQKINARSINLSKLDSVVFENCNFENVLEVIGPKNELSFLGCNNCPVIVNAEKSKSLTIKNSDFTKTKGFSVPMRGEVYFYKTKMPEFVALKNVKSGILFKCDFNQTSILTMPVDNKPEFSKHNVDKRLLENGVTADQLLEDNPIALTGMPIKGVSLLCAINIDNVDVVANKTRNTILNVLFGSTRNQHVMC